MSWNVYCVTVGADIARDVMLIRLLQPLKALFPMLVTPLPMVQRSTCIPNEPTILKLLELNTDVLSILMSEIFLQSLKVV